MTGTSTAAFLLLSHTAVRHPAANMETPARNHSHLCSLNISLRLTLMASSVRPLHRLIAGLPRCGREYNAAEVYAQFLRVRWYVFRQYPRSDEYEHVHTPRQYRERFRPRQRVQEAEQPANLSVLHRLSSSPLRAAGRRCRQSTARPYVPKRRPSLLCRTRPGLSRSLCRL